MRTDSIGTVLQQNHYYPYGMLMGESSDVVAANRANRLARTDGRSVALRLQSHFT